MQHRRMVRDLLLSYSQPCCHPEHPPVILSKAKNLADTFAFFD